MQKNCPVDEYSIPDSTKSLQARAQAAMLNTVSHSFSYSPGKAAGGTMKIQMSANRRNSQRPNYDIVNHSNLNPKLTVDKAVLYNPLNQTT